MGSLPHSRSGFIRGKWNRFRVRLENGPHSGARPGALMDHTFFALVAWPVVDGLRFHTTRERKPQLAQATGQPEPTLRQSDSPLLLLPVFPLEDRGVDLFEPVGDDARRFVVIVDAVACIGEGHGIRALGIAEGQSPVIPITRQIGEGPGTEFALVERIRTNFVEVEQRGGLVALGELW